MNRRDASRLSRIIEACNPCLVVTGLRHYSCGHYALDVEDRGTGSCKVFHSVEEWADYIAEQVEWGSYWEAIYGPYVDEVPS